jgi:enoyl-CoA hydratase
VVYVAAGGSELMTPRLRLDVLKRVARITIENARRRNAMTLQMWERIPALAAKCGQELDVRCVVITGEGAEAFSAGADISEFRRHRLDARAIQRYDAAVVEAVTAIAGIGKPTLAVMRGICIGGGAALAIACDLRFAATDLRFAIPAARLGTLYPRVTVRRLVDLIGSSGALDLLLSARTVFAEEALRLGLVNRVGAPTELEAIAEEYVEAILNGALLSIRGAWLSVRAAERWGDSATVNAELDEIEEAVAMSADYQEGISAFLEKRPPKFS